MFKGSYRSVTALVAVATLAFGVSAAYSVAGPSNRAQKPVRLDDASMIVEVNATDGDAGLQVFLDGKPWRSMSIFAPDGRRVRRLLDVKTRGRLEGYGLTELFSESSEPPFEVFPLKKFKRLFPAGRYTFVGRTVEGRRLVGAAHLSHAIPRGPRILAPPEGASLQEGQVVARWAPVNRPRGIDIVGYRVIVEREDPLRVFSVDLPASARRLRISPQFLEPGVGYLLEIQAIARSGNQTSSELDFAVR